MALPPWWHQGWPLSYGFAGMVALGPASPRWPRRDGGTRTGCARRALGWPRRDGARINLTSTTLTGLTGIVALGWPHRVVAPGLALLGWHWNWHYWDWPRWDGTRMVLLGLPRLDLRDAPWIGLTGTALGWPRGDGGTRTALGWPRREGTGTGLAWDGVRMAWPGWHQGLASLGQHCGGLLRTCDPSVSPRNHPIWDWGDPRPPLLPVGPWESRGLPGLPAVGLEPSTMVVLAISAGLAIAAAGGGHGR